MGRKKGINKTVVSFSLTKEVRNKIKKIAEKLGSSSSFVVSQAIEILEEKAGGKKK